MDKNILQNSSWLWFGQLGVKAISFGYTLFIIRYLSVGDFGFYVTATAYFSLLSSISDLGVSQYMVREIASGKAKIEQLLPEIISLRLFIVIGLITFGGLFMSLLDRDSYRVSIILLGCLAVIPQMVALTLDSILIAKEKLALSAKGLITLSLGTTIIGAGLLLIKPDAESVLLALISGQIIYFLVQWWSLRQIGIKLVWPKALPRWRYLLSGFWQFWIINLLGFLYFKVDTLMLTYWQGSQAVGIYGTGYKFLESVIFIPSAISAALFPVLARMADKPKQIYPLFIKSVTTNLLISAPLVIIFWAILPWIIDLFLPGYREAIPVVKILAWTIPFIFMISPHAVVMMSIPKLLKPLLILSIINLIINVTLNSIFIPKYSYLAASWVTLISDIIGFCLMFGYLNYYFIKQKND